MPDEMGDPDFSTEFGLLLEPLVNITLEPLLFDPKAIFSRELKLACKVNGDQDLVVERVKVKDQGHGWFLPQKVACLEDDGRPPVIFFQHQNENEGLIPMGLLKIGFFC